MRCKRNTMIISFFWKKDLQETVITVEHRNGGLHFASWDSLFFEHCIISGWRIAILGKLQSCVTARKCCLYRTDFFLEQNICTFPFENKLTTHLEFHQKQCATLSPSSFNLRKCFTNLCCSTRTCVLLANAIRFKDLCRALCCNNNLYRFLTRQLSFDFLIRLLKGFVCLSMTNKDHIFHFATAIETGLWTSLSSVVFFPVNIDGCIIDNQVVRLMKHIKPPEISLSGGSLSVNATLWTLRTITCNCLCISVSWAPPRFMKEIWM